jgi:ribosomal-protein-alanine N-acetyltransferase
MSETTMIRAVQGADLPYIMVIEKATQAAPWTEETFKICFRAGYQGWVAELNHKIIGFIFVSLREAECHILNLCIEPRSQRQGWGRRLLEAAVCYAQQQGTQIAYLEVRRSNTRAIHIYTNAGFQLIGERKDYYPILDHREDALVFGKSLNS